MRGMMAQVIHDLRSPLNRVQGILQLISKAKHEENEAELIQISLREVMLGRAFVDNLLKSTSYREWIPEWSEFDMAELVKEIISRFAEVALEKNISVQADVHPGFVRSDRIAVDRILDNLLSNAIKYSPPWSNVCCSRSNHKNGYTLRVADKGPGFTEEDQKKMFTAFQRLSAKPTGGESSFGVGLSSVNDLVKVLKGTIELKTSTSLGSEFIVTLPNHPIKHVPASSLEYAM
ncbi:MAG: sensor histidine kinase [Flammeovirgaceae bacterium]